MDRLAWSVTVYLGIDLAAEAVRTGLAVMRDDGGVCVIERVLVGADDENLVAEIRAAQRVGVDVPIGWPTDFIDFIRAHAEQRLPRPESTGGEWRRSLAMRTTDLVVHERTGITPLSVSTDRIARAAMRWAGIETRLRDEGIDATRDGSGLIAEVYPAAALKCWSLRHRGYKGLKNQGSRSELVEALTVRFEWLDWNGAKDLCAADDNALDAVLAAVIARDSALGRCEPPPRRLQERARREGWIWLPRQ